MGIRRDFFENRIAINLLRCHRSLFSLKLVPTSTSIAFVIQSIVIIVTFLATSSANAQGIALPSLGNTEAADRQMLREVPDEHVHERGLTAPDGEDTEQKTPEFIPSDPPEASAPTSSNVWSTIQSATRIEIPDNQAIKDYREQYEREALWVSKILSRASPYIGHVVEQLDSRFLPIELALLPAIESGFLPDVVSAGNAAGIWQIVPITAKEIGIERNQWYDGRKDIARSTTAAIDYLSYLNAEFNGDWMHTLAAYNAGPGRVRSAIRKNRKNDKPTDYWSLELPDETENYVPKFLALIDALRDADNSALTVPEVNPGNALKLVDVGVRVSIDKVAAYSSLSESDLKRLNAGLVHGVTPPKGPHVLYIPRSEAKTFVEKIQQANDQTLYSLPLTHTVVAGDSISSIALEYGISQRRLKNMNGIEGSHIWIGQKLAVLDKHGAGKSAVAGETLEYVVSIGDTLSDIASKFSVRLRDITDQNGKALDSDIIHPGERLSISTGS